MNSEKLTWHRSTSCTGGSCVEVACAGGNCVEVAACDADILIRDSKNPGQAALRFSRAEWDAFQAGVAAGDFRF